MDHAAGLVRRQRLTRPAGGQLPRGVPLPLFMLPTNLGDLDVRMTLGDRPKRRAGLNGLKLLGIATLQLSGQTGHA